MILCQEDDPTESAVSGFRADRLPPLRAHRVPYFGKGHFGKRGIFFCGKPPWQRAAGRVEILVSSHSTDHLDSVDELFRKAAEQVGNKIAMNRRIYGGAPCIAGTRVPVYAIMELVEAGWSAKKILSKKGFPMITADQLAAALHFATLVTER